jgi:hypothetical protein
MRASCARHLHPRLITRTEPGRFATPSLRSHAIPSP